jgi:LuxR family transcriptional activator of bioluminescence operon
MVRDFVAPKRYFCFCYIQMFYSSLEQPMSFLYNHLPEAWQKVYADNNYQLIDPSWAHARSSVLPFYWSDLKNDCLTLEQQAMLIDAQHHGLCSGVLLPFHGWAGFSLLWIMSHLPEDGIRRELDIYKSRAWDLFPYLFEATSRIIFNNLSNLSQRESECLYWAAEGLITEQIANKLFIASVTVEKHIKNACNKLKAKNRSHAVRIARDIGVFKPNERSFLLNRAFNEKKDRASV